MAYAIPHLIQIEYNPWEIHRGKLLQAEAGSLLQALWLTELCVSANTTTVVHSSALHQVAAPSRICELTIYYH